MPCNVEIIVRPLVAAVHRDVLRELLGPHVAAHHLGVTLEEVYGDQAVEAVVELGVDVEGEELAAHLDVLAEQDRDALLVGLDVLHHLRDEVEVVDVGVEVRAVPLGLLCLAQAVARTDEAREVLL